MKKDEAREILGVKPGLSNEEIKKVYKKKALATHPDKNPNDPQAKEKFQFVSEAYKCLTDESYMDDEGLGDISEEELFNMFNEMFFDMFDSLQEEFGQMADGTDVPPPPPEFIKAFLKHTVENEMNGTEEEFDFNSVLKDMDPDDVEALLVGGGGVGGIGGPGITGRGASEAVGRGGRSGCDRRGQGARDTFEAQEMMQMMMGGLMGGVHDGGALGGELTDEEMAMMAMMMGSGGDDENEGEETDELDDEEMAMMAMMMGSMGELGGKGMRRGTEKGRGGRSRSKSGGADGRKSRGGGCEGGRGGSSSSSWWGGGEAHAAKEKEKPPKGIPEAARGRLNAAAAVEVGKLCVVNNSCQLGTVRFVGGVHYAKGEWVGVELEEGGGKNNGTIKGTAYFSCASGHGIMVRPADVTVLDD